MHTMLEHAGEKLENPTDTDFASLLPACWKKAFM